MNNQERNFEFDISIEKITKTKNIIFSIPDDLLGEFSERRIKVGGKIDGKSYEGYLLKSGSNSYKFVNPKLNALKLKKKENDTVRISISKRKMDFTDTVWFSLIDHALDIFNIFLIFILDKD